MTAQSAVSREEEPLGHSVRSNAVFSLILFFALIPILGPGLPLVLFALTVLSVWTMPGGQAGYGDQLQIDAEGHVTALGFRVLLAEAARFGCIALVSSILICMRRSKGMDGPQ